MSRVIGNGLIGNNLKKKVKNTNFVFFASGVSNSNEENETEFLREKNLFYEVSNNLKKDEKLIYFSTYSVYDESLINSAYKKHKIEMEKIVQQLDNYLIIRLPNVIGHGGNPNTLINYFRNSINNEQKITILKNAYRNILDIDDIICFINKLENEIPKIIDLIHPVSYSAIEIFDYIEKKINKKAELKKIEGGMNYFKAPDNYVMTIFQKCKLNLTKKYLFIILDKYI